MFLLEMETPAGMARRDLEYGPWGGVDTFKVAGFFGSSS
jgi:hypothetical protein